jgi:aminoglycoside phosphotransferase (APT) family kinase protein
LSEPAQPVADLGIPTLSETLDPIALAKHLRLFSLPPWNWGDVMKVKVCMLKGKPGRRCTLELGLQTETGWHSLIGKVYATDRPDVFQAMERINRAGFGPQEEFSIPQPLAYLPSLHLLVQEKVEGSRAAEIFRAGDVPSCAAAAERCARWLARFHSIARKAGPVFDARCCLGLLRRRSHRIGEVAGRFADKAARLRERLEDAASSLSRVELRAGHGSYSGAHVIPAADRTVVFDWDGYGVADPARDVGRFLAALRHSALGWLGSIRVLDAAAEVFLKTYLEVGQPEVKRNLPFYEAAGCLKLAKWRPDSSDPRWYEKTEAMLDEGLRSVEQEAVR